jgi:hypothetical protein
VRLRVLLGASLVVFVAAAACDLNPQPLPPGEQPDAGNSDTVPGGGSSSTGSSSGGSTGTTGSSDAGTSPPFGLGDAGALALDAALADAALDGTADGSTDAALDAADAGDE